MHSGLTTIFPCVFLFTCGVTNADPTPSPSIAATESATPSSSPRSLGQMSIQELRNKELKSEGAKGTVNVPVPAGGVYATIDIAASNQTMTALQASTGTAKSDLIRQIESKPGDYTPPVLYMLAKVLYQDGNVDAVLDGEIDEFIEAYLLAAAGGTLKKGGVDEEADA